VLEPLPHLRVHAPSRQHPRPSGPLPPSWRRPSAKKGAMSRRDSRRWRLPGWRPAGEERGGRGRQVAPGAALQTALAPGGSTPGEAAIASVPWVPGAGGRLDSAPGPSRAPAGTINARCHRCLAGWWGRSKKGRGAGGIGILYIGLRQGLKAAREPAMTTIILERGAMPASGHGAGRCTDGRPGRPLQVGQPLSPGGRLHLSGPPGE
jgi:hypothetical protein